MRSIEILLFSFEYVPFLLSLVLELLLNDPRVNPKATERDYFKEDLHLLAFGVLRNDTRVEPRFILECAWVRI